LLPFRVACLDSTKPTLPEAASTVWRIYKKKQDTVIWETRLCGDTVPGKCIPSESLKDG